MTFIRARRDEQKAERRETILASARLMCMEVGVMNWSLNELGKRASFTKSNLYRYFGSREEILMTLLHEEIVQFSTDFSSKLMGKTLTLKALADSMAETFESQPFLCDLLCVSSTVLEENTEPEKIWEIKCAGFEHEQRVVEAIESATIEMNRDMAEKLSFSAGVIVAGLWPLTRPSAPLRKLMIDNQLDKYSASFGEQLSESLHAQMLGLVHLHSLHS